MHSSLDAFTLYTSDMIRVVLQRGRSSVNSCRQLRRPRNSIFDAGYDELHIDVVLRCLHVTALCSESMVWEHGSVWTFVFCISARAFLSHFHRIFRRIFVASCFLMWRELHPSISRWWGESGSVGFSRFPRCGAFTVRFYSIQ